MGNTSHTSQHSPQGEQEQMKIFFSFTARYCQQLWLERCWERRKNTTCKVFVHLKTHEHLIPKTMTMDLQLTWRITCTNKSILEFCSWNYCKEQSAFPKNQTSLSCPDPLVEHNKISKLTFWVFLNCHALVRQCHRQLIGSLEQDTQIHVPKAVPIKDFHNKLR